MNDISIDYYIMTYNLYWGFGERFAVGDSASLIHFHLRQLQALSTVELHEMG